MGQRPDDLTRFRAEVDEDPKTAAARDEIEQTRAEMTGTIDEIQDRLDPEVLSEHAKETAHDVTDYAIREAKEAAKDVTEKAIAQAKEAVLDITGQAKAAVRDATIGKVETMARSAGQTAGGWRQTLTATIRQNPLPAAAAGLSLAWLYMNRTSGGSAAIRPNYTAGGYGAYQPMQRSTGGEAKEAIGHAAEQAQHTAGEMVGKAQDTVGQVAGKVQDTGEQLVDGMQEQASRAQGFLQRQLQENPLLVGAVAVAVGGVLAGMMPATEREDHMLGETRDRVIGSAKELTEETIGKVGSVVDEAKTVVRQEAEAQHLIPTEKSSA